MITTQVIKAGHGRGGVGLLEEGTLGRVFLQGHRGRQDRGERSMHRSNLALLLVWTEQLP